MPHRVFQAVPLLLLLALTGPVPGAAPPPPAPWQPAVERLVAQLGDPDYRLREQAEARLAGESPRILPLLKKALGHPDAEVRKRALRLVHLQEMARLFAPQRVTLKVVNKPLAQIINELQKASGYKIQVFGGGGRGGGEPNYSYSFDNEPFWDVIERLCRDASLVVQQSYGDDIVRLQGSSGYAPHASRDGAFRLVPTSFNLYRNVELGLVNPKGGGDPSARSESLNFNFTLYAEPRLPILNMGEVRVEAAYDSEKNSMLVPRAASAMMDGPWGMRGMWMARRYYSGGNKQLTMQATVTLNRPSEKASSLALIRGVVPLTLLVEQKPLVVTDKILSAKGLKLKAGDSEFHFEEVSKQPTGQYQIKVTITNNSKDTPGDNSWMNNLHQRIELQDDKGNKYQVWGSGWGGSGPNHVQMTLTYAPPAGVKAGEPARFIYQHWEMRQHDVHFEFRNLPLP